MIAPQQPAADKEKHGRQVAVGVAHIKSCSLVARELLDTCSGRWLKRALGNEANVISVRAPHVYTHWAAHPFYVCF